MTGLRDVMFCGFLAAAAAWDLRKKRIPEKILLAGGLCGIPWAVLLYEEYGAIALAAGFLPGLLLLAVSRISREAVGRGDGLFFLVAALYLPPAGTVSLLLGGILCCGLFCALFLLCRFLRNRSCRGCSVPFLPFLIPVWGILLLSGALKNPGGG